MRLEVVEGQRPRVRREAVGQRQYRHWRVRDWAVGGEDPSERGEFSAEEIAEGLSVRIDYASNSLLQFGSFRNPKGFEAADLSDLDGTRSS